MPQFLSSLMSKKLGFAAAVEIWIQQLPMNADWKGICTASVAVVFLACQAYVDAKTVQARALAEGSKTGPNVTASAQPPSPSGEAPGEA